MLSHAPSAGYAAEARYAEASGWRVTSGPGGPRLRSHSRWFTAPVCGSRDVLGGRAIPSEVRGGGALRRGERVARNERSRKACASAATRAGSLPLVCVAFAMFWEVVSHSQRGTRRGRARRGGGWRVTSGPGRPRLRRHPALPIGRVEETSFLRESILGASPPNVRGGSGQDIGARASRQRGAAEAQAFRDRSFTRHRRSPRRSAPPPRTPLRGRAIAQK